MHRTFLTLSIAVALLGANSLVRSAIAARAADVPLIPRDALFGNPERANVQLSHDGKYISWLAAVDGVLNARVAPVDALDKARSVTTDTGRAIPVVRRIFICTPWT